MPTSRAPKIELPAKLELLPASFSDIRLRTSEAEHGSILGKNPGKSFGLRVSRLVDPHRRCHEFHRRLATGDWREEARIDRAQIRSHAGTHAPRRVPGACGRRLHGVPLETRRESRPTRAGWTRRRRKSLV